jgi:hypothetical protein
MKKTNKKSTTILKNQQFKLGSIINPIIEPIIINSNIIESIDSIISIVPNDAIDDSSKSVDSSNIESNKNTIQNESNVKNTLGSLIKLESKINPIDFIFGGDNNGNENRNRDGNEDSLNTNSNADYLKQIYPPLIVNNSLSTKNIENQIFTNIDIKTKIDKLSENEMFEIFKIIKNNKEKYSTNKNGIFINLSTLKSITITEICNFLNFCDKNNVIFDNEEKTRDIYREMLI